MHEHPLSDWPCRHGARTPLTSKHRNFESPDLLWDCCGRAYTPVPISLTTTDGRPAPENSHNTKQAGPEFWRWPCAWLGSLDRWARAAQSRAVSGAAAIRETLTNIWLYFMWRLTSRSLCGPEGKPPLKPPDLCSKGAVLCVGLLLCLMVLAGQERAARGMPHGPTDNTGPASG